MRINKHLVNVLLIMAMGQWHSVLGHQETVHFMQLLL